MEKGQIHIYTGNGKGKTTAALGLALRSAGAGHKVWIGQFAKGTEQSEHTALKRFDDLVTIKLFGKDSFILKEPDQEDIRCAKEGLAEASEILTLGEHRVVILDEACIAIHFNLITLEELLEVIEKKPEPVELIITGRNAPQKLIDAADLVTEMREVKHYYTQGIQARRGIEK